MMQKCGEKNNTNYTFGKVEKPKIKKAQKSIAHFCTACGGKLLESDSYCSRCGSPV